MIKRLILFSLWAPLNFCLLAVSLFILIKPHAISSSKALNKYVFAQELAQITPSPILTPSNISPQDDIRITALTKFLKKYDSPLTDTASYLVTQADRWGLDYTLIPSISMQESLGCKIIPENSFNCWGFGIYGSKVTRFSSYEEAIDAIAKKIKETYIKNGLVNPTLLENVWAPQSDGQWSYAVNYFSGKIKDLEKNTSAS